MLRKCLIICFLVCYSLYGFSAGERTLIEKANNAYSEGLYTEAVELYKQVADAGYQAPELYYNLGNSYFKLTDYTSAILWYERAKRLDPANEDINFNLNVANSKIADKIDALPELFYVRWFNSLVNLFPVNSWALQTIIFFILTLTSITFYFISRRIFLRKIGFWAGILFLALTLSTLVFSFSGYRSLISQRAAIIFDPTITVKSSPDAKSIDLFVLHEGTRVQLLDRIGEWYEIRIANGSVGWLPESALEEI